MSLTFNLASLRMLLGNVGDVQTVMVRRNPAPSGGKVGAKEDVGEIEGLAIVPRSPLVDQLIPADVLAGGRVRFVGLTDGTPDVALGDDAVSPSETYRVEWRGLWAGSLTVLALSQAKGGPA